MADRHSQHSLDVNNQTQGIADESSKRQAAQQALMRIFSSSQEVQTQDQTSEYGRLQAGAPRWMWFLDVYLDRYKNGLLEINPAAKGAQRQVRRLIAELLFEAIEAATEDLNETFIATKRNGSNSSTSSGLSTRGCSPAEDQQSDGVVMGVLEMPEEEQEPDGDTIRLKALGEIVRVEMEEMAEAAKDAIDDLV